MLSAFKQHMRVKTRVGLRRDMLTCHSHCNAWDVYMRNRKAYKWLEDIVFAISSFCTVASKSDCHSNSLLVNL